MTIKPLSKDLVGVLISWPATPKMRMEQRFLLPRIGFSLQHFPPALERGAIRSDNPGPARHDARTVVVEQILKAGPVNDFETVTIAIY